MTASLQPSIERLESLFKAFNERFYNGDLQKPVITISPDSTSGAYGWCTGWKAWKDSGASDDPEGGYYEINLCAEYLARPFKQIAETLLHEMVHLYNLQIGVKDTSRSGTYHNERYRKAAVEHGLHCEKHDKYGWTLTSLTDEAAAFVDQFEDDSFKIQRQSSQKAGKGKTKQSMRKYICPECGQMIRATKAVKVLCGICTEWDNFVWMEPEEQEPADEA